MDTIHAHDTKDDVTDFTSALYRPSDIVEVRIIGDGRVSSTWHTAVGLPGRVRDLIRENRSRNIYIGANPRPEHGAKGDKCINRARSVFADFDGVTVKQAKQKIADARLPRPSIIIASGHGTHCYWLLAKACTDLASWRLLQHDLSILLDSDPAVKNAERVMRLPGFVNHKPPEAQCRLIRADASTRYTFDELRSIVPTQTVKAETPAEYHGTITEGQRNNFLAHAAGKMRRAGFCEAEILAALLVTNQNQCVPPLSESEVKSVVASVAKYPGGKVTQAAEPVVTCMADVEPVDVSWLWPGRIPLGRISLLVGRPGEGKSFLTVDMAATVTRGHRWPDGTQCQRGSVLIISGEDDPADTIRPRLDACGAKANRVHLLSMVRRVGDDGQPHERMFTLADVAALEAALTQIPDCRLIVVDPIGSFLGGQVDSHRDSEVRAVLAPVAALAAKYGPAVVVVAHRRKSRGDFADDLALGSRAFTGIARAVWHVSRDPKCPERRLLLPGKNNLAKEGDGLAFCITGEPPKVVFERDPVHLSADEGMAEENDTPGRPADEREAAEEWLRGELADMDTHPVDEIHKAANAAGLVWRTVQRAASALHVERPRAGFGGAVAWRLPAIDDRIPERDNSGIYGTNGDFCRKTAIFTRPKSHTRQKDVSGTNGDRPRLHWRKFRYRPTSAEAVRQRAEQLVD